MTIAASSSAPRSRPFGVAFAPATVTARWTVADGWSELRLDPLSDLSLSPATMIFHYGQAIFEGLKAYRSAAGDVRLFRPERNAARFQASARRMSMPELPQETFVAAAELLVDAQREQVPVEAGHSLYLRPFMIATEATLGTRPANEYLFSIIASPSGPYFSGGFDAITVWATHDYVRAAPGGTGAAKCAGNYAGGMIAQRVAAEHGCDQVVFLDAIERRYLEELGGMNIFLVVDEGGGPTLVTPPTSDTILDGITRASLLELAPDLGLTTAERRVDLAEWESGALAGTVLEAFACGTAAVVTPIGRVRHRDGEFTVGDGCAGQWSARLRERLLGIQEGVVEDTRGWVHPL
ncbi:branched-chain amino acid aminotransferase [Microbacterium candidum]|uniref:Branched-chain-amino-acid aminotransferase n=1 Tax=Microbacterium candidum TaxID=3041922 RepID=A0ABT7MW33_9MICO|nr:branched-chain amino acid aminotransferase [Microbacterium sp. ASV49]MDL9978668.1 branched-chain amino acid aminotransferase [Microbacterium sp. ASV49]